MDLLIDSLSFLLHVLLGAALGFGIGLILTNILSKGWGKNPSSLGAGFAIVIMLLIFVGGGTIIGAILGGAGHFAIPHLGWAKFLLILLILLVAIPTIFFFWRWLQQDFLPDIRARVQFQVASEEEYERQPILEILRNRSRSASERLVLVQQLLESGKADPNTDFPLGLATAQQDLPMLKLLLSYGADPNRNPPDQPPIWAYAAQPQSTAVINRRMQDPFFGAQPIVDHRALLHLLLKHETDMNLAVRRAILIEKRLKQPGKKATETELCELLRADGAGETSAATEAASLADTYLRRHRIKPEDRIPGGDTTYQEIVLALLKAGANPNAASVGGETPLLREAAQGNADLVEALLAHGANPYHVDAQGRNAVDYLLESPYQTPEEERIIALLRGAGVTAMR